MTLVDVLAQDDVFSPGSPWLTAPDTYSPEPSAPPSSPPQDPLRARMESSLDAQQRYIDRAASQLDRGEEIADQKSRALAPLRQRQMELASRPLPEPPTPKEPPQPPQRGNQHDDEQWLQAAMLLGALAGGLTRRHMTNALGAMQGAIEGYSEGSRQKFDQNMRIWDASNKKTVESNTMALNHYREILENRKQSIEQMSVELQMAAAQYDDQAMATAAKSKNSLLIAQLYDRQAHALGQFNTSAENLALKHAEMQRKERSDALKQQMRAAGFGTGPEQMQATIDAIGQNREAPIRGRAGTLIMNEVNKQYPGYNESNFAESKYRQLMGVRAESAAATSAERTAATRGANLEMILRTTRVLIPQAMASSSALPRTSFVPLNRLLQMGDSAIGDPKLKRLKFDTIQVAEGWARSMNPTGIMRESDREIALNMLGTADSPAAYNEILRALDQSMVREIQAVGEQRRHEPVAPLNIPETPSGGRAVAPPIGELDPGWSVEVH